MTITELAGQNEPAHRCELVWDLPNQTATLSDINNKPGATPRLDFAALGRWLAGQGEGSKAVATVFANVITDKPASTFQGFITAIRNLGFAVFAKPRIDDSDIDDDLVAHVESVAESLAHLIIGTHDRELIRRCIEKVGADCLVTVLGFEECSSWASSSPRVTFVDLEDIPDLFPAPLTRTVLRCLPAAGVMLPALAPLPTLDRPIVQVA